MSPLTQKTVDDFRLMTMNFFNLQSTKEQITDGYRDWLFQQDIGGDFHTYTMPYWMDTQIAFTFIAADSMISYTVGQDFSYLKGHGKGVNLTDAYDRAMAGI